MNLWPFSKKSESDPIPEKKSIELVSGDLSFAEYLYQSGYGDLSAHQAIKLFKQTMPLYNAVTMRAEAFSSIPIRIWDRSTDEWIDEHPALDLLRKPNADVSQCEFLEQISSFYDITGNSFLVATGRLNNPPLELIAISPAKVTLGTGTFGLLETPRSIEVNTEVASQYFQAEEFPDLGLRWSNRSMDGEAWQIRSFNPQRSASNGWGLSKASVIWLEAQTYLSGNKTNLSVLKRSSRLSMAWVNNRGEELTETQWERLQAEAKRYQGDERAGGTTILDGMDVKALGENLRDLEFQEGQKAMISRISTVYGIPLALLLSESMTLNNLETAIMQFYDKAVLPTANRIYADLTRFLLARYPDSENLEFRYNERDIGALRERMINTAERESSTRAVTTNEVRATMGYSEIEGGDELVASRSIETFNREPNGTTVTENDPEIRSHRLAREILKSTLSKTDGS